MPDAKTITRKEFLEFLASAFREGFMSSGDGWNGQTFVNSNPDDDILFQIALEEFTSRCSRAFGDITESGGE